jgi:hypothetical protein
MFSLYQTFFLNILIYLALPSGFKSASGTYIDIGVNEPKEPIDNRVGLFENEIHM